MSKKLEELKERALRYERETEDEMGGMGEGTIDATFRTLGEIIEDEQHRSRVHARLERERDKKCNTSI